VTGLRNLFLLLVLLNLGAWAFFNWVIGEPEPTPMYDGAGITLLRELDPDAPLSRSPGADVSPGGGAVSAELSAAVADVESLLVDEPLAEDAAALAELNSNEVVVSEELPPIGDDDPTLAQVDRCISIGPFSDVPGADAAMAVLAEAGFAPTRSIREVEVWDGYWVYIAQIDGVTAARAIQADLAENGLDDTQVISGTERGTLLSLGVFSEITRAGAQAERVNRIGYEATISDNLATRETQWLDVMLNDAQSIELESLQAPGQISRLELLPCVDAEGN
jgi:hypothetical protein